MKIIISSFGTYYSLHPAKIFQKDGNLVKYITGVPKKYIENHQEFPNKKFLSLKVPFLIGYICIKFRLLLGDNLYSKILRYSHNSFSKTLAKNIKLPFDFFIITFFKAFFK